MKISELNRFLHLRSSLHVVHTHSPINNNSHSNANKDELTPGSRWTTKPHNAYACTCTNTRRRLRHPFTECDFCSTANAERSQRTNVIKLHFNICTTSSSSRKRCRRWICLTCILCDLHISISRCTSLSLLLKLKLKHKTSDLKHLYIETVQRIVTKQFNLLMKLMLFAHLVCQSPPICCRWRHDVTVFNAHSSATTK